MKIHLFIFSFLKKILIPLAKLNQVLIEECNFSEIIFEPVSFLFIIVLSTFYHLYCDNFLLLIRFSVNKKSFFESWLLIFLG